MEGIRESFLDADLSLSVCVCVSTAALFCNAPGLGIEGRWELGDRGLEVLPHSSNQQLPFGAGLCALPGGSSRGAVSQGAGQSPSCVRPGPPRRRLGDRLAAVGGNSGTSARMSGESWVGDKRRLSVWDFSGTACGEELVASGVGPRSTSETHITLETRKPQFLLFFLFFFVTGSL